MIYAVLHQRFDGAAEPPYYPCFVFDADGIEVDDWIIYFDTETGVVISHVHVNALGEEVKPSDGNPLAGPKIWADPVLRIQGVAERVRVYKAPLTLSDKPGTAPIVVSGSP